MNLPPKPTRDKYIKPGEKHYRLLTPDEQADFRARQEEWLKQLKQMGVKLYTLSSTWMHDHIDVWNEEEFGPRPSGVFRKDNTWIGPLSEQAIKEIRDRAEFYCDENGPDADCDHIKAAAGRVLKALDKQGAPK